MKHLDKVKFRNMEGCIISERDNGNFDISINDMPVIYEDVTAEQLVKL